MPSGSAGAPAQVASRTNWISTYQVIAMRTFRLLFVVMLYSGVLLAGCIRPQPQAPPLVPLKVVVTSPVSQEIADYEEFKRPGRGHEDG